MKTSRPTSHFWFIAAIAIIPFVYSTHTIDPAFTLRGILLSALTIVTIIVTRKQPIRYSPILYIWCAYAAFNIISIFVAVNSGEAIYKASIVLLYGAWLFAAMQIMTKEFRLNILRTIAILGFAVSFISLFQFFDIGFTFIPYWAIPAATMTTKNLMSSFLYLTLPATVYITFIEKKNWSIFGLLTLTMSIFVLLIAQTRAVWLATSVAGLVALVLFVLSAKRSSLWKNYKSQIRNSAIAVTACLIAIFILNIAPRTGTNDTSATEKAGTIVNYAADASAMARLNVWDESMQMFKDYPILGVGPGNWKIVLPRYGLSRYPPSIQSGAIQWTETHNDFLANFCETGSGGGLAFLAFFVFAIYLAIRSARAKGNNPHETILAILIASAVCGFAVISFFDFPNSRVEHSMIFMLWISMLPNSLPLLNKEGAGGWLSRAKLTTPKPPPSSGGGYMSEKAGKKSPNGIWKYAAIVFTFPALLLTIQHFIAELHENALLQHRIDQDWSGVIAEFNKIYDPQLLSVDALSTPLLYYKAEAEFMQSNYDDALRDNIRALRDHPNHLFTMNNIASCYVKVSNFSSAEVFYKRALAISPNFEESLLNLATVYFNQNKLDSAFEYVRRCDTTQEGSRAQKIARAIRDRRR